MNRKQVILLLAVLAIIGGAGLVLLKQSKDSWSAPTSRMGEKVLSQFQPNDVAAIHIKGRSDLNLARKNNLWVVQERGDYPANFHVISDMLLKLKDLKVVQADTVGPSDLSRVELDEPGKGTGSGTLVEFKDEQGKVIESLLLGKRHILEDSPSPLKRGSPDGRYILLPANPKEVLLVSDALGSLEPNPPQWLSKDFFKLEGIKTISLASTNPVNSWKLSHETESSPWAMVDIKPGEALDTNKVHMAVNALAYPVFTDVIVPTPAPAASGLDKPMVVTFETFNHFVYTLKIGGKAGEQSYYTSVAVTADIPAERVPGKDEKPEDKLRLDKEFQDQTKKLQDKLKQEQALAPWVYLVNSWILDPLLRDRAQLFEGKKPEKSPDAEKTANATPPPAEGDVSKFLIK